MLGSRDYTGAGIVRNPFLWLLFMLFLYFLFFPNVFMVPLGQGNSSPVIEFLYTKQEGDIAQNLVTLQGDLSVIVKKKGAIGIRGSKAFQVLFMSSLLCFQPNSQIRKSHNLPAATPSVRVNFRMGVVSRSFQFLGYKDPSELQGKGMLSLFNTIYTRLTTEDK